MNKLFIVINHLLTTHVHHYLRTRHEPQLVQMDTQTITSECLFKRNAANLNPRTLTSEWSWLRYGFGFGSPEWFVTEIRRIFTGWPSILWSQRATIMIASKVRSPWFHANGIRTGKYCFEVWISDLKAVKVGSIFIFHKNNLSYRRMSMLTNWLQAASSEVNTTSSCKVTFIVDVDMLISTS